MFKSSALNSGHLTHVYIIEMVMRTGESDISLVCWNSGSFNTNKNQLVFSQFYNSSFTQHLKWQLYSSWQ